jgi:hypothetical protein
MSYRRRQNSQEEVAGSAGLPTTKRAVKTVDTNTRKDDPFISRRQTTLLLSHMEVSDPQTGPVQAVSMMVEQGELITLPRPKSGEQCLTVADRRRIAMCLKQYQDAGEKQNAQACLDRLEEGELPEILDREYVRGP